LILGVFAFAISVLWFFFLITSYHTTSP
jgi:hypothetical protein